MDKLTQEDGHNEVIFSPEKVDSVRLSHILCLVAQYRKARKGTQSQEHQARERLFEFAEEVTDGRWPIVDD